MWVPPGTPSGRNESNCHDWAGLEVQGQNKVLQKCNNTYYTASNSEAAPSAFRHSKERMREKARVLSMHTHCTKDPCFWVKNPAGAVIRKAKQANPLAVIMYRIIVVTAATTVFSVKAETVDLLQNGLVDLLSLLYSTSKAFYFLVHFQFSVDHSLA